MNTMLEIKKLLKSYIVQKKDKDQRKTINMFREFYKDDLKMHKKLENEIP